MPASQVSSVSPQDVAARSLTDYGGICARRPANQRRWLKRRGFHRPRCGGPPAARLQTLYKSGLTFADRPQRAGKAQGGPGRSRSVALRLSLGGPRAALCVSLSPSAVVAGGPPATSWGAGADPRPEVPAGSTWNSSSFSGTALMAPGARRSTRLENSRCAATWR